jgi:hypothetical protein
VTQVFIHPTYFVDICQMPGVLGARGTAGEEEDCQPEFRCWGSLKSRQVTFSTPAMAPDCKGFLVPH